MRKLMIVLFWLSVLVALVFALLPQPPMLPGEPSDKLLHVLAFAVMAGLAGLAYPAISPLRILMWLCGLGAAIEIVQLVPSLNRDAQLGDFLADGLAAGAVLLLVVPVLRRLIPR